MSLNPAQKKLLVTLAPWIFVFLWSTGFVAAKFTVQYSAPFHLLFLRGLFSCIVFFALALILKASFPSRAGVMRSLIVGLFLQSFFLGGCFYAIHLHMPPSIVALVTGLQPVLTALIVSVLHNQRLSPWKWLGITIGFIGVFLVLSPGKHSIDFNPVALFSVSIGLLGVTIGSLYQRKTQGDGHVVTTTFLQYVTLTITMGAISFLFASPPTQWSVSFALGLTWLVIGVSVLAILLLIFMIHSGEATKVATYFYLVPILTAIEEWLLFDQAITVPMILGMVVTVVGLLFVIKK